MLASSKAKCSKTLALPVIHYEFYKSVMQSVELFCVYRKSGKTTNPPSHLLLGLTGILYLFSCKSQVYIQSIVCVLNLLFYKNLMVPDPRKFGHDKLNDCLVFNFFIRVFIYISNDISCIHTVEKEKK